MTPTDVIWDTSTGISKLGVATTEQGYYTCTITGQSVYNIAIFNDDSTTSELINVFKILESIVYSTSV